MELDLKPRREFMYEKDDMTPTEPSTGGKSRTTRSDGSSECPEKNGKANTTKNMEEPTVSEKGKGKDQSDLERERKDDDEDSEEDSDGEIVRKQSACVITNGTVEVKMFDAMFKLYREVLLCPA